MGTFMSIKSQRDPHEEVQYGENSKLVTSALLRANWGTLFFLWRELEVGDKCSVEVAMTNSPFVVLD